MFRITFGKGFHVEFENGVTVSTQFGEGNYCNNRNGIERTEMGFVECEDSEVAIWGKEGEWLTREYYHSINEIAGDDVKGSVSPKELLNILNWAENYNDEV